jgi:hypothetical protein
MALTPPKKYTWYLCILLWIVGVILAFGLNRCLIGSLVLALSQALLILAVYAKGI